ncbi:hypothetical protein LQZ24_02430 [Fructobacillus sp. M1-13]|nr:hypothetical protein [Fructobacillus papyriferae]MCD2158886.1 hypothetical protein [Fructobacillus papyriferae]
MTMVAFPFFVIAILFRLYQQPLLWKKIVPSKTAFVMGLFVWVVQFATILSSYMHVGESKVTWGLIHSLINLGGWTVAVYLSWAVIQLFVRSEKDEKKFVKSGLIALLIYLIFVIFPQILVTLHVERLNGYVNTLASFFESHWQAHGDYNFYANGSYATTLYRVNGFEPEASYLANMLSVIYLPILVGLSASGYQLWNRLKTAKQNVIVNVLFTFTIMGTLVLARTSTGIFAAVIAFILWVLWSRGYLRLSIISVALLGVLLLAVGYSSVPTIHNTLNQFLFAKQGTDNRTGGTIALALTFLSHPLTGVGTGFTSYFTIQNIPEIFTHNFEYEHVYSQYGFPILSEVMGWFASFGLVVMLPAIYLLIRLVARSFLKTYRIDHANLNVFDIKWDQTLHIAFITMIVMIAFSSIFIIRIYLWPYLLMFFFYREHLIRAEKELQS